MKKSLLFSLAGAAAVALTAYAAMPRENVTTQQVANNANVEAVSAESSSSDTGNPIKIDLGHQKGAKPANMTQLCKDYVLSYTGNRAGWTYPQGNGIKISRLGTTDTVVISGGWYFSWVSLKAVPNFTEGTLFVPNQYVGDANSTQACWFIKRSNTSGTSYSFTWDEGAGVTFAFQDDGTITCPDSGWALAAKTIATGETTNNGWAWTIKDMTTLYPANGTMTFTNGAYNSSKEYVTTDYTVPIWSKQEGNILTVCNFWNKGTMVNFIVNSNGSLSVPDGTVLTYGSTAKTGTSNYSAYDYVLRIATKVSAGTDGGTTVSWQTGIFTSTSNTTKSATFGPFTVIGTDVNGSRSHGGYCAGGTLNFNTAINTSSSPFTGAGTAANPFKISNITEMQAFLNMASKTNCGGYYFKQTADIDLGGQAMTMCVIPEFAGVYDGGGFSLKGLNLKCDETGTTTAYYYQALIKKITETGVIKNLTLEGEATFTRNYCAVLAAYNFGRLENVVSKVNCSNTQTYCSGLVAMADEGSEFINCVYAGDFTVNANYAAGLAGYARHASFVNCGFTGKFIPTESAKQYVGGIAAYSYPSDYIGCYSEGTFPNDSLGKYRGGIIANASGSASATGYYGTYNIKKCVNRSNMTGAGYMGGMIGSMSIPVAHTASNYMYRSYMNIDSCENYGDFHVTGTASYTGGISANYNHSTRITNCVNYGNISSFRISYAGGIVGSATNTGTDSTRSYIGHNVNYGNFTYQKDQTSNYYVGGVVGSLGAYTTLENCNNYGNIESYYELGGIAGYCGATSDTIRNCVNYGDVIGSGSQIGGMVGYTTNVTLVIDQCANFGNIKSTSELGSLTTTVAAGYGGFAIGGIMGKGRGNIINCLNAGTITGAAQVGGMIGQPFPGTTETAYGTNVENCLNTGKVVGKMKDADDAVVASLDTVGAIIGVNQSFKTTWYNPAFNKASNNYYIPSVLADYGQIDAAYKAKHADAIEIGDAQLVNNAAALKAGWKVYDKYCWPAPIGVMQSDMTKIWAAQVVAKGGDILPNVTTNLLLGKPAGVRWTSSVASLNIKGNDAIWSEAAYTGPLTLTATCGDYSKEVVLNVTKATGVETLDKDGKEVVSEMWINANGVKVARPMLKDGNIYIVIRKYSDGTAENIKVFN